MTPAPVAMRLRVKSGCDRSRHVRAERVAVPARREGETVAGRDG
jgi:hypothetical protein